MRVTVLGGSAAGPNTGQGCSGYLVEADATRLVLDLGPGTLPELRRHADFRTLDGIVVSHLHLDHVLDLFALRFALAYNPRPAPRPFPLWLPPGGAVVLAQAAAAFVAPGEAARFFEEHFALREYDPASSLAIGGMRLSFAPTAHFVPCWAIRVAAPGTVAPLVYTADTGPAADLASFARGAGLLIAEATEVHPSPTPPAERGHMTAVEAGDLARHADAKTLLLTHLWEEHDPSRAQSQASRAFAGRIEVARPGFKLSW